MATNAPHGTGKPTANRDLMPPAMANGYRPADGWGMVIQAWQPGKTGNPINKNPASWAGSVQQVQRMNTKHNGLRTVCQQLKTPVATLTVALHITVILQRGGRIGTREIMQALETEYGISIQLRQAQRLLKSMTHTLPICTDGGNPAGYWWHGGPYAQELKRAAVIMDDAAMMMQEAA